MQSYKGQPMGLIYEKISIEKFPNGMFKAQSELISKHTILSAHFPGHPIVPGVIVLSLFRILASMALGKTLRLKNAGLVKFVKPLIPKDDLLIEVEFLIKSHENGYEVEGKVFYAGEQIARSEGLTFIEDLP